MARSKRVGESRRTRDQGPYGWSLTRTTCHSDTLWLATARRVRSSLRFRAFDDPVNCMVVPAQKLLESSPSESFARVIGTLGIGEYVIRIEPGDLEFALREQLGLVEVVW